jgi:uncharacterized protein YbcI
MSPSNASPNAGVIADQESVRAEISRRMVKIYKDQFGRGPTKARTDFAGPDIVVSTLENTFTPAERSLVQMGEHQRMRDTRLYFQHASEMLLKGAVEEVLNRRVRAFISGIDTGADVATEIYYLERREDADGSDGAESVGRAGA